MFGYNRDSWMTDIQIAQNRRFQRQNIGLSQAEMFRDDIRDLVAASVTKQSNYVLMATLILGITADAFKDFPVPEGSAEFLQSVLLLCLGTSLLYLVMSVLCALSATVLATNCQRDLLTTFVRLPVDEFVAENEAAASAESVEAFEHQSWSRQFRIPYLSRLRTLSQTRPEEPSGSEGGRAASSEGRVGSEAGREEKSQERSALERLEVEAALDEEFRAECRRKAKAHLDMFRAREGDWEILGHFAFTFGALGSSHLLHAFGYFAAIKFYLGASFGALVVQALLVVVDAIFARGYLHVCPCACAVLTIAGPLSGAVAMRVKRPHAYDEVCIPVCFLCHLFLNVIGGAQLLGIARAAREGERPASAGCGPGGRPAAFPGLAEARGHPWRFQLIFLGSVVVIVAWVASCVWAVYHAFCGDGDNGRPSPYQAEGLLELSVRWPSFGFQPSSLACGLGCFASNGYVVLRLDPWGAAELNATSVRCSAPGPILDLAVVCDAFEAGQGLGARDPGAGAQRASACRPWALSQLADGRGLLECDSGSVAHLAPGSTAHDVSAVSSPRHAQGVGAVFTLQAEAREVLQRSVPSLGGAWEALWPVLRWREGSVPVALDFSQRHRALLLFYESGAIEALDIDSGARRREWRLGPGQGLVSGTLEGSQALVLARGRGQACASEGLTGGLCGVVRLLRISLPGLALEADPGEALSERAREAKGRRVLVV